MTDVPAAKPAARYARELSALVLVPIAIWLIGWSHEYIFDAVMAAICALALHEFLALGRAKGYHIPTPLCIGVMLVIIAAFVLPQISVETGMFLTLLAIPAYYVFSKAIPIDDALPASAISVLATMYVGMLGGSTIRLRHDFPEGPKLIFFLALCVWLGDTGAYYTGKNFGKTKLLPRISPKKTVEGLIGGIVTSALAATVMHFTFLPEFPLFAAIVMGVILSAAGVIGDLAESMWKRSAAVKDSGTLIPGHGGFLDRFDSILFTAPMLYMYWAVSHKGVPPLNMITG